MTASPSEYTPVQRRTLDALRRTGPPVAFDPGDIAALHADAARGLAKFAERMGDGQLRVTKHAIAAVLDCEARYLAPDDFAWTAARARGQVSHKAIQLLLNWRAEPTPADLVDAALARLADDDSAFGEYVAALATGEQADVRGQSVDRVTKFLECFPALEARWHPVTEASSHWPVDGSIVLRAKADLVVGRPEGRESRKLIIDLKSGLIVARHREDLRFYALVETLCRDVPPRKLASFSLDAGTAVVEDVSLATLHSALRRTLDAVERMVELRTGTRPPTTTPGPSCRWCALRADCAPGTAFLARDGDRGDGDPNGD